MRHGVEHQLRRFRRLVGRIDAGEIGNAAGARLGVQALDVALLAHFQRRIDEHLDELAGREQVAGHPSFAAERRDERDQHDQAGIDHQFRNFGDAADVLDAVLVAEAKVVVQAMADVVAVEQVGVVAAGEQAFFDHIGDGRLARTR